MCRSVMTAKNGEWKCLKKISRWELSDLLLLIFFSVSLGAGVGVTTHYGLDGPGIESRWWRDIPHPSRPTLGPKQRPVQCVLRLFPQG
jgi:hypothetical protein